MSLDPFLWIGFWGRGTWSQAVGSSRQRCFDVFLILSALSERVCPPRIGGTLGGNCGYFFPRSQQEEEEGRRMAREERKRKV